MTPAPVAATIRVRSAPHPSPAVRALGLPIDHPYVERCWASVIGPTAVLFLRRVALLVRERSEVAVDLGGIARDLGVTGAGRTSRVRRAIERLERFGFAAQVALDEVVIYGQAPTLAAHHLDHASHAVRCDHRRLLTALAEKEAM